MLVLLNTSNNSEVGLTREFDGNSERKCPDQGREDVIKSVLYRRVLVAPAVQGARVVLRVVIRRVSAKNSVAKLKH